MTSDIAIELRALGRPRFSEPGDLYRGLSLTVPRGSVLAVVGPNGAGKSTLLRDLCGLTTAPHGSVHVSGRAVSDTNPRERARIVSYLPQSHDFPHDLRAREVVALGRAPHRTLFGGASADDLRAVREALEQTDTAHLAERGILTLSGGERQRVMLARMLATETPILVLDEPTTALDVGHALALLRRLCALAVADRTVVFSVHDLDQARRIADRVLVLRGDSGDFFFGTPDQTLIPEVLDSVFHVRTTVGPAGLSFEPGA